MSSPQSFIKDLMKAKSISAVFFMPSYSQEGLFMKAYQSGDLTCNVIKYKTL